jgi:hypothetical protein
MRLKPSFNSQSNLEKRVERAGSSKMRDRRCLEPRKSSAMDSAYSSAESGWMSD